MIVPRCAPRVVPRCAPDVPPYVPPAQRVVKYDQANIVALPKAVDETVRAVPCNAVVWCGVALLLPFLFVFQIPAGFVSPTTDVCRPPPHTPTTLNTIEN